MGKRDFGHSGTETPGETELFLRYALEQIEILCRQSCVVIFPLCSAPQLPSLPKDRQSNRQPPTANRIGHPNPPVQTCCLAEAFRRLSDPLPPPPPPLPALQAVEYTVCWTLAKAPFQAEILVRSEDDPLRMSLNQMADSRRQANMKKLFPLTIKTLLTIRIFQGPLPAPPATPPPVRTGVQKGTKPKAAHLQA